MAEAIGLIRKARVVRGKLIYHGEVLTSDLSACDS